MSEAHNELLLLENISQVGVSLLNGGELSQELHGGFIGTTMKISSKGSDT